MTGIRPAGSAPVGPPVIGSRPAVGPPVGPPAVELIEAGFELENADAPVLHHGMNLADLAHLLDLASAGVIPAEGARQLLRSCSRSCRSRPGTSPRSGRRRAVQLAGAVLRRPGRDVAGWLRAGRPRRGRSGSPSAAAAPRPDRPHRGRRRAGGQRRAGPVAAGTLMADQTYPPMLSRRRSATMSCRSRPGAARGAAERGAGVADAGPGGRVA